MAGRADGGALLVGRRGTRAAGGGAASTGAAGAAGAVMAGALAGVLSCNGRDGRDEAQVEAEAWAVAWWGWIWSPTALRMISRLRGALCGG